MLMKTVTLDGYWFFSLVLNERMRHKTQKTMRDPVLLHVAQQQFPYKINHLNAHFIRYPFFHVEDTASEVGIGGSAC